MGGGKEAKRRRTLLRAGLDVEGAKAAAAKEFEAKRSEQQKEEEQGTANEAKSERKKLREKRKREQKQLADEAEAAAKKKEQPVANRKRKRASTSDDAALGAPQPKGNPRLTVFVGQLPFNVDERALEEHFVKAGIEDIVNIRMLTEKGTKRSKGMAFVQLPSEDDVVAALKLHQSELSGRVINVERSVRGLPISERPVKPMELKIKENRELSVFVAQLPYDADKQTVREHFESSGVKGVAKVKMLSERGTNRKGMAFVQLSDEDGVLAALQLDKSQFGERAIVVERSGKQEAKQKAVDAPVREDADADEEEQAPPADAEVADAEEEVEDDDEEEEDE